MAVLIRFKFNSFFDWVCDNWKLGQPWIMSSIPHWPFTMQGAMTTRTFCQWRHRKCIGQTYLAQAQLWSSPGLLKNDADVSGINMTKINAMGCQKQVTSLPAYAPFNDLLGVEFVLFVGGRHWGPWILLSNSRLDLVNLLIHSKWGAPPTWRELPSKWGAPPSWRELPSKWGAPPTWRELPSKWGAPPTWEIDDCLRRGTKSVWLGGGTPPRGRIPSEWGAPPTWRAVSKQ